MCHVCAVSELKRSQISVLGSGYLENAWPCGSKISGETVEIKRVEASLQLRLVDPAVRNRNHIS